MPMSTAARQGFVSAQPKPDLTGSNRAPTIQHTEGFAGDCRARRLPSENQEFNEAVRTSGGAA